MGNKVCVCLYTTLLTPSLLNPLTCSQDLFLSLTATDNIYMYVHTYTNIYIHIYMVYESKLLYTNT